MYDLGMYSSNSTSPSFKLIVLGRYWELSRRTHHGIDAKYALDHFPGAYGERTAVWEPYAQRVVPEVGFQITVFNYVTIAKARTYHSPVA